MESQTFKEIRNRDTGTVLHRTHATSLRRAALSNLDLAGAALAGEDLRGADLDGTRLNGADLSGANLRDASLKGAVLKSARLPGAGLQRANLYGASVRDADLAGADFTGARVDGADFRGASLEGAMLADVSFGNRLPGRADLAIALRHIAHVITATPPYLFRELFPMTLPVVGVVAVFLLLRLLAYDYQYDRSRLPSGWPEALPGIVVMLINVAALGALAVVLRRTIARLGTRHAFEGYLGLLFFFVTGVYLIVAVTGYVDDVTFETWDNTVFRVLKVLGFAVLTSVLMGFYGVPARMRRHEEGRVDGPAFWKAVGALVLVSALGLVMMNARMIAAPFLGEFPAMDDVDSFHRHVRLYFAMLGALLAMWALLPRLPVPATLGRTRLTGAVLHGAALRGISMRNADLTGADLIGAELRHADLRGANLEGAELKDAVYDSTTRWPDGFDPEARGAVRVATPFWHVPILSLLLRRREF